MINLVRIIADQHELVHQVDRMIASVDETIDRVRNLSSRLRPAVLDDLGLFATIEWLVEDFQERTGLKCHLALPEELEPTMPSELMTDIFRICQESLTNVARHAQATELEVHLSLGDDQIMMRIQDNGKGITKEEITTGDSLGLLGMRERTHTWNGEIEFLGKEGVGTEVFLRIPLK